MSRSDLLTTYIFRMICDLEDNMTAFNAMDCEFSSTIVNEMFDDEGFRDSFWKVVNRLRDVRSQMLEPEEEALRERGNE